MNLRQVLRRLVKEPGFSLVAVLALGLGIGVNVAIFSIVDGALLRPLSYPQPDRLITLDVSIPQFAAKYPYFPINAASFITWQRHSRTLDGLAMANMQQWVLTAPGQEPLNVSGSPITYSMFTVLGVKPELGRDFTAADDRPGKNNEVILSDTFWRSEFHADPRVIGRTIDLNGTPNVVVGVMPAALHFPNPSEIEGSFFTGAAAKPVQLFQPAGIDYVQQLRDNPLGNYNYFCVARMRPAVTTSQVRAELDVLQAQMLASAQLPPNVGHLRVNTVVHSLQAQIVGNHALGFWMLLGATGVILAIVCLNLSNVLLVRVQGRAQELAVRMSLGASPARLLADTVNEGVVLAIAGSLLGLGAAWGALRILVHAAPAGIPRLDEIGINGTVVAFCLLAALVSGVLFSGWPGWRAARTDPQRALRAGGRGASDSRQRLHGRAWLVGGQAALAALLLTVAGLLIASYVRLLDVNKGFQTTGVVTAEIDWHAKWPARKAFYNSLLEQAHGLPGVEAAGLVGTLPTQGTDDTDLISFVHDTRPMVERPLAVYTSVSPGYFAAMGIELLRGRDFNQQDMVTGDEPTGKGTHPAPIPAVITRTTADLMWPGRDPIGQQFKRSDPDGPPFTVVGEVADVRVLGLDKPAGPAAYLPYTFEGVTSASLVLRTGVPAATLGRPIRQAVRRLQPAAAVSQIESMGSVVDSSVAPRRFQLSLVLVFSLCALLLAALGIYAVVAYTVQMRGGEVALRLALGASQGSILNMVLQQGMLPVVLGLLAGAAAAAGAGRLLASLLFGVHADNPAVLSLVAMLLLVTAIAACLAPAHRASRIDPAAVLKA